MSRRTLPRQRSCALALLLVPLFAPGQEMPSVPALDAQRLHLAGLQDDPAALLDLVQPPPPNAGNPIEPLLKELEADDYDRRQKAGAELVHLGRPARAALARLAVGGSLDVRRQAWMLVSEIDARLAPATILAALRTLCRQQHPRAAELVLEYLPHADLAGPQGSYDLLAALLRIDPGAAPAGAALLAALTDPEAVRRAAAGLVLARRGTAAQVSAVLPLLEDRAASVRLRTAQGLLGRGDTRGLPALVGLLAAPLDLAWQAEELLRWVAGSSAPKELLGNGTAKARQPCQQAWAHWLADPDRAPATSLTWAALMKAPRRPALFLTCRGERLNLIGSDGGVRFSLDCVGIGVGGAFADAHLMPDSRFLIFDDNDAEVRLCEPTGKVVWRWKAPTGEIALTLQPLPDEKRIVAVTDEEIHELSTTGKHLGSLRLGEMFFLDACLVAGGRYAAQTDEGFFFVDRHTGRFLSEIRIPGRSGNIENGKLVPLPEGQLGLVSSQLDRIQVFDLNGTAHGGPLARPRSVLGAARYSNGNWLLSQPVARGNLACRLAEFAPDGRVIREVPLTASVGRVRLIHEELRLGLEDAVAPGFSVDTPEYRIAALRSPDMELRRRSAILLGQYPEAATQAIPALVETLNTPDAPLQTNAARSLARMGPAALPPLVRVARAGAATARVAAVRGLGLMHAAAGPAVPDLVAILEDTTAALPLRTAACDSLALIGPAASPACPALRKLLATPDADLRRAAIFALGNTGGGGSGGDAANIASLSAVLDHPEEATVAQAALALGMFGGQARPAVPRLVRLLEKSQESKARTAPLAVRQAVALTLGDIGADAPAAVTALAVVVRDRKDDAALRQECIRTLGRIGPRAAAAALPALRAALLATDRNGTFQQDIFRTLVQLRHVGGLAVLVEAARNGPDTIRYSAVTTLGSLGGESQAAVAALTEMKSIEKSPRIQQAILRALARIPRPPTL